jgi:hypothetical protein
MAPGPGGPGSPIAFSTCVTVLSAVLVTAGYVGTNKSEDPHGHFRNHVRAKAGSNRVHRTLATQLLHIAVDTVQVWVPTIYEVSAFL